MLCETLEGHFHSVTTPYMNQVELKNCSVIIRKGILEISALDFQHVSDGRPLGLKFGFLKVLTKSAQKKSCHAQVERSI